jgi:hypothetical protein
MSTPQQGDTHALARVEHADAELSQFMPALSIEQAIQRRDMISEYVSRVLKPNEDFGVIPGAGTKPVLLKPGAEKLCTIFGLSKQLEIIERVEDWTGDDHNGEPFFYYLYRFRLLRGGLLIAEGDGSCNSRESKYRYRKGERTCPSCSGAFIIKGQEQYGGGWLCFKKKGGCGAKFPDGDQSIESQQAGRVLNPDICDQVNTIQKMAAKRALVAATLLAVNASDFFTQDVEDMDHGVINVTPNRPPAEQQPARQQSGPRREQQRPAQAAQPANGKRPQIKTIENLRDRLLGLKVEAVVLDDMLGQYGCTESGELTDADAKKYTADLSRLLNETLNSEPPEDGEPPY